MCGDALRVRARPVSRGALLGEAMHGRWKSGSIADLGRVVTGRTPPGNDASYYGSAVPFLTPSDMDGRRRVERTARSLSSAGASWLARCLVPRGVGVSCIVWQMGKAILIDQPTVTNQQINSIIVDERRANCSFVYYVLLARRAELFNLGAGGSRTPILNKGDFERLPFPLPPLPEQRAIAHILGTLDDKIELNRQMNKTLEDMAQAIFKSWFIDFDGHTDLVESELGPIPRGWEAGHLSDLLTLQRGFDLPASGRTPGPYPVYAAGGHHGL
ncbi:MAG: restriction endonuclease subunit S [Deltaproteobacteria bacterium]|nr:restriction endonuclease subunit S [Deltaproteobacteria bacterium]